MQYHEVFQGRETVTLVEMCGLNMALKIQNAKDPFSRFFFNIPYKLGMKKHYKAHWIIDQFLLKMLLQIYEKRYNEFDENTKATNIMDMMCCHNKKCAKDGRKEEIFGEKVIYKTIQAFFGAGYETALSASISGVMWMSQNHQDWIERIRNEGISTMDEILNNDPLELCYKEILRLYNPGPHSFARVLINDIQIQGVQFKKGDRVTVLTSLNKWDNKYIKAKEFRPERFESEVPKLKKLDYIPFFEGKRKCIGYNLANFQIKFMIGYMMNKYELKVDKDYVIRMGGGGTFQTLNPTIEIKLK